MGDRLHVSVSMHEGVSVIKGGTTTGSSFRFIDLSDLSAGQCCFIETHQGGCVCVCVRTQVVAEGCVQILELNLSFSLL